MAEFVYLRTEPGLWTVGHYDPSGKWQPESDHDSTASAADRVAYLNGGGTRTDEYRVTYRYRDEPDDAGQRVMDGFISPAHIDAWVSGMTGAPVVIDRTERCYVTRTPWVEVSPVAVSAPGEGDQP